MKKIMILFSLFCMMIVSLYPDDGDDFRKSLGLMPTSSKIGYNEWIQNKYSRKDYLKVEGWTFLESDTKSDKGVISSVFKRIEKNRDGKIIREIDSYYTKRLLFGFWDENFLSPSWNEHLKITYNYEKNRLDISYFGGDREIGEFLNKYFDKSKNNFSSPWSYDELKHVISFSNNSQDPPHPEVTIDMCGIDVDLNDVTPEAVKDVLAFIYKKWDIKLPK